MVETIAVDACVAKINLGGEIAYAVDACVPEIPDLLDRANLTLRNF